MDKNNTLTILHTWDQQGRFLFTKQDLGKLLNPSTPNLLGQNIKRLVKAGILKNICRNVYLYAFTQHHPSRLIEEIATFLRRGKYNYVSLESMLSEYGAISQIPLNRLTVMTTGRNATYHTGYGTIEFTHTDRPIENILSHTRLLEGRPLRVATKETAWRDLKRVGRNMSLVDTRELFDEKN